ncbi:MAG: hypothetical protein A2W25_08195 [candidate division Zixibacteria bacterium RBG_16_53_22]|nr:MAG: hypothetical protein A2W25_08195 [candidate division Zixibacteria bacterium RBG_16_53_22]
MACAGYMVAPQAFRLPWPAGPPLAPGEGKKPGARKFARLFIMPANFIGDSSYRQGRVSSPKMGGGPAGLGSRADVSGLR